MLLQGERGRWLRGVWIALGVAVLGCAVFAPAAGANPVRHFERVSPADKGDGDIIAEGEAIVAAKAGDGAAFDSRMVFGDAIGSGVVGRTTYVARRVGDGVWSTHAVTPTPRPETNQVVFAKNTTQVFSDDLSTALTWAYDLPAVGNDTPQRMNLYVEDTATRSFRPVSVSQVSQLQLFDFIDPNSAPVLGVSDDAKHLAFGTTTQMLPDADPFSQNIYKWDNGVLSVASKLPDGSVPSVGASVVPSGVRNTMSPDGSRVAFTSSGQLYMHIDGTRTAWLSEPERSSWRDGTDTSLPTNVVFEGMTPDAKNVFFVSDAPLLDTDLNSGPDLYRYTDSPDPASDQNLTLITNNGGALSDPSIFGGALVGMSDDARIVYVHDAGGFLKVWDDGVTRTVDPSVPRQGIMREQLALTSVQPGHGRVSSDGKWLAYINNAQMWMYDLRHDEHTCVSCPGDASLVPTLTNAGALDDTTFRPRFLSNNGRVFFTSTGALVPEDTNGVADVYEYDAPTRTISLISSGKSTFPSMFADASASGDDVFIVTRNRLVSSDRDNYVDLYDVRVGPAPPDSANTAPACEGEACQGSPSSGPADDSLGSLSLAGDQFGGTSQGRLRVSHRATVHGSRGTLRVKLTAAGRLQWSGRGLVAGSVKRGSAGTANVHVRLGQSARTQLRRAGGYTTTVHLTFLAADGKRATGSIRVTFRAVAKKGR